MDRTVHKARNSREAEEWDRRQQRAMTPQERQAVARALKERVYGRHTKDVREWHRKQ